MLTAKDISSRLAARVESVCSYLIPGGKHEGAEYKVGSIGGGKGDSLSVRTRGDKAGVWSDFATGSDKGDLLDLWAAVRGVPLGLAIKEAKGWLGLADPVSAVEEKKYSKPKPKGIKRLAENPDSEVEKYLIGRGLSKETILAYKVGMVIDRAPGSGIEIAFPYCDPDQTLVGVKYLGLQRGPDGKKKISAESNCAPTLFGWQTYKPDMRIALIAEGEIDSMTWHEWGVVPLCLSIPNGAESENWISHEWDNLCAFDTIYLSWDMDKPGRDGVKKVARRLGVHRCMIVSLPHDDANECLQKGCKAEDAAKWLIEAKPMAPQEIKAPREFYDEILADENPDPNAKLPGLEIPILGRRFRFRPGETTLWTGYSFHGKSSALNQMALYAAMEGEGVAIGSFEVKAKITCAKLSKCLAYTANLLPKILKDCLDWMSGKIWLYDIIGIVTEEKVFELMLYSVMRHGVKHVVIDSLMKCDISSEDYEAQRKFLNRFLCFCHEHDIHGHIVAHPKKTDNSDTPPDMMDVLGGNSISGQPDNVIAVWRNFKKENKREDKTLKNGEENELGDTIIYVRKQRTTGDRYKTPLWYSKDCNRFTSNHMEGEPSYPDFGIIKKGENDHPDNNP